MASNNGTYTNHWVSNHENDGKSKYGGRDCVGYGNWVPKNPWPNRAKVAINIVINFQEGGEKCVLHGDKESERRLSALNDSEPSTNQRNLNVESEYEYGSRAGFWRLHRMLITRRIPVTVFGVGMALARNPGVCNAMKEANWEVASHGYRWFDDNDARDDDDNNDGTQTSESVLREQLARTIEIHEHMLGKRPVGIYFGSTNETTLRIVIGEGGFLYSSDSYADDLPYWCFDYGKKPFLMIPYSLSENDGRFCKKSSSTDDRGFATGQDFTNHLKDTLRVLMEEGRAGQPKLMTIVLHSHISGRPGRAAGLQDFLIHVRSWGKDVWFCTRQDIADYWYENHYPKGGGIV